MFWLLLFVPILLVVATFVAGMSWYIAHSTLQPPRRRTTNSPEEFGLPHEDVTIDDTGPSLRGWFVPAASEGKRPAVVLIHGWGASAEQLLPVAQVLYDAGFHALLISVRGHGESDAAQFVSISRYADDIRRAVDAVVRRHDVDSDRIGLLGHSMGAAAALLEASGDQRVKAVASSAGFADFNDLTSQLLKWRKLPNFPFRWLIQRFWMKYTGVNMIEVNPVEAIRRVACPVLLLHGDLDHLVPPDQLEKLHAHGSPANLRRVLVPGRDHHDVFQSELFKREVVRFFREVLEQRRVATE